MAGVLRDRAGKARGLFMVAMAKRQFNSVRSDAL